MFKSGYSFRQAVGSVDALVERLAELGYEYAPLADIASVFGHVHLRDACKKHGLKPVYGVSLNVTPAIEAKKPATDLFSFYAVDDLQPLYELIRLATSQFRYTPLLKYEQVNAIDNLIVVTGSTARLDELLPRDNVYVGLAPSCAIGYVNWAKDRGFQFTMMQDQRYIREDDFNWYETTTGRNARAQTYPMHVLSENDWRAACEERGLA